MRDPLPDRRKKPPIDTIQGLVENQTCVLLNVRDYLMAGDAAAAAAAIESGLAENRIIRRYLQKGELREVTIREIRRERMRPTAEAA